GELAGRELGRVDLPEDDATAGGMTIDVRAQPGGSAPERLQPLVEHIHDGMLAAFRSGDGDLGRDRRLAGARRSDEQRRAAAVEAAADQLIELGYPRAGGTVG